MYANSPDDYESKKEECLVLLMSDSGYTFKRDQYLHYDNTTNSHLESHNQKLKDFTSRRSTLSEMFNNVVLFSETCEAEYKQSSFIEEFKVTKTSVHQKVEDFSEVTSTCTKYTSNTIAEQIELASSVSYSLSLKKEVVEVTSPNGSAYLVHPSCV